MDYLKRWVINMKKLTKEQLLKNIGIYAQAILSIFLILTIIVYAISKEQLFINLTIVYMSLLMFVMAYNNHIMFKRKYFSILYIVTGLLIVGSFIFSQING